MRRSLLLIPFLAYSCAAQYSSVENAIGSASSQANVLAPAMLAKVGSLSLALSAIFVANPFDNLVTAIPTNSTAKVFIRPAGSSAVLTANVVSATTTSVTFVVPAGLPYGTAELAWQIDSTPWQSINVTVGQTNFELARIGSTGPALAQNLNGDGSLTTNGLTTPARPGQTVSLSGSGLGYGTSVSAMVGGLPATVIYAGRGSSAGRDQIQLQVPSGAPDSCYLPLVLSYGQSTVTSSISVTSGGAPCQHPFQLSLSDMKSLDTGGSLATVLINMSSGLQPALATAAWRSESAYGNLNSLAAADLFSNLSPLNGIIGCTLSQTQGSLLFESFAGFLGIPTPASGIPSLPDVGPSMTLQNSSTTLTLNGSGGEYSATLPTPIEGSLTSPPAPIIAPGKWTWRSPGSTDLDASSFDFTLPAPLQISGGAPISLRRNQDQTVTWNGTAFDPATIVTASLSGATQTISCTAMARTGSLTIPQALLSSFPGASIGSLFLNASPAGASIPHALLKTKSGDTLLLLVSYTTSDTRPVDFQ